METITEPVRRKDRREPSPEASVLIILWCQNDFSHVGEILSINPRDAGQSFVFGRGGVQSEDPSPRLELIRQRPGVNVPGVALTLPGLSRVQLIISRSPTGALQVNNVGRRPLFHNGCLATCADVIPGDLLEIENQLLFLCLKRPLQLSAPRTSPSAALHSFGGADAHGMVGESPAMWTLRQQVALVADLEVPVLILGASGTGKELIARAIHGLSRRRRRPMVSRSAATFPETLIDAELFGNLRNFPNAGMPERPGLVGEAHLSTLFLDEIGELPHALQAHLLRVVEVGEYHRLGEALARQTDFRLLGATNRPESALKEDFRARFKVQIRLPDLNERREDIPLLVRHLVARMAKDNPQVVHRYFEGESVEGLLRITPGFIASLTRLTYSTHVRELEAHLWQAVIEGQDNVLDVAPGKRADHQSIFPSSVHSPDSSSLSSALEIPRPPPPSKEPSLSPVDPLADVLGPLERERLFLLRRHRFHLEGARHDPAYDCSRATAYFHLRVLLLAALIAASFDTERAAVILSGEVSSVLPMGRRLIGATLERFSHRLRDEGEASVRASLDSKFGVFAPRANMVVDAILQGRIRTGAKSLSRSEESRNSG